MPHKLIGLIREGRVPPDKRVPFTPDQVVEIQQRFPHVQVVCQSSDVRCFRDEEYSSLGVRIVEDLTDCDIIMGIKEVPVEWLIPDKTFLFFSHTIKQQPQNRRLLQSILKYNIQLIDYEVLRDRLGNRLVAFGRYAGIVGAYNALWTFGKRFGGFQLKRAFECFDVNDLKLELRKVALPPIKIILTGTGRVGKGAMETLDTAGIKKVSAHDFLHTTFDRPVYVQLGSSDYHVRRKGGHFNREEFHKDPSQYASSFREYAFQADMLIAGAFWKPGAPLLFTKEDMLHQDFKIRIIADITCDIDGSIPSTIQATSISDPLYEYNPVDGAAYPVGSNSNFITVMAIDNLPCELPRSASEEFGRDLIDKILPPLLEDDKDEVIKRATIAKSGMLTPEFQYLTPYIS